MSSPVPPKTHQLELFGSSVIKVSGQLREDFVAKEVAEVVLGQLKADGKQVEIDVGSITSMNSVGINQWIRFIATLEKTHSIVFSVVSETFIEIALMIPNLLGKPENRVVKLVLPYRCPSCKSVGHKAFPSHEVLTSAGSFFAPSENCPKCAVPMVFDAMEEEYQSFLRLRAR